MGDNKYPTTVTEAFNKLLNWKDERLTPHGAVVQNNAGHISFYKNNVSDEEGNKPKKDRIHILFFCCGHYEDHYESECP